MSQIIYRIEQEELLQAVADKVAKDHPELGIHVHVDIYAEKKNGIAKFWAEVRTREEEGHQ